MHRDAGKSYLAVVGRAVAGRPVYLTIDVDGLDPSVIPATGTPEPGGIGWYDCLDLIRTVAAAGRIIGIDCVELAPTLGSQAANFAAAKLVYKAINYTMRGRS
jgi:agmatinase